MLSQSRFADFKSGQRLQVVRIFLWLKGDRARTKQGASATVVLLRMHRLLDSLCHFPIPTPAKNLDAGLSDTRTFRQVTDCCCANSY